VVPRSAIGPVLMTLSLLFLVLCQSGPPTRDRSLTQSPAGKDWVTNGGNLTNQRYSTLKQLDTSNVKNLKGLDDRLKGSGLGGKYSHEATPLVKDGVMYVITGNDDAFAVNAKTGEFLWEYWSGIDQKISTRLLRLAQPRCGVRRGMVFFGQLDANVVALDAKTGKVVWKTPIEKWENGYTITSAPIYYDGMIYRHVWWRVWRPWPPYCLRRQEWPDPLAGIYAACPGEPGQRDLAAWHRPFDARWGDDLEYASP